MVDGVYRSRTGRAGSPGEYLEPECTGRSRSVPRRKKRQFAWLGPACSRRLQLHHTERAREAAGFTRYRLTWCTKLIFGEAYGIAWRQIRRRRKATAAE